MNPSHYDPISRDQIRFASTMNDNPTREGRTQGSKPPMSKKSVAPKGHEAFLKALESSGSQVQVEKISSGELVIGQVKHSDKYTVTMRIMNADGSHINRVLFKHDISEFSSITQRPETEAAPVVQ
jgi:sRNA-binding regulator protein Hfq